MKFPHLFRPKEEAPVFLASPLEATNLKFPHLFRPKEEAPVFLASPLEATNHEISSSFQAWRRSSSLFSISPWSCVQRLQSGASLWGTSLIVSLLLFLSYFSFVVAFALLVFIERGVEGGRGRVHSKKAYDFCEDWPVGHQTKTVEKQFKFDIAVTSGPGPFCFTSTETRLLIWGRDRGGRAWEREGSTADTTWKRPERPWTAARTMEVLRRCLLAITWQLVHCAIAVSSAVLGRVTRTISIALLLRNNSKWKKANFRSPAPPPCSWSLLG